MTSEIRFCAWMGPLGQLILMIGMMLVMQVVPPPAPSLEAEAIQALYLENINGYRLGSILLVTGASAFVVFYIAVSAAMLRMTPRPVVLSGVQAASAIVGILPLLFAAMLFATASFRPERSMELIYLLNDISWMFIMMPASTVIAQPVALGIAILKDRSPRPVFPHWIAYLNFWIAILFQSGLLVVFFKQGPFAWDGLFAFWIPFSIFFVWNLVMCWALLRLPAEPGERAAQ